jgi:hypothetical protein
MTSDLPCRLSSRWSVRRTTSNGRTTGSTNSGEVPVVRRAKGPAAQRGHAEPGGRAPASAGLDLEVEPGSASLLDLAMRLAASIAPLTGTAWSTS